MIFPRPPRQSVARVALRSEEELVHEEHGADETRLGDNIRIIREDHFELVQTKNLLAQSSPDLDDLPDLLVGVARVVDVEGLAASAKP